MVDFEIFAEGCGFPEGPLACDDGSVLFGDLRAGTVVRARPGGRKEIVATVKGATPGLAIGPDGALYCCNNGGFEWGPNTPETNFPIAVHRDYQGGSIERIDLSTGKVERLYDSCDGVKLAGPNDIVFDKDGGMWFSDLGVDTGEAELHGGIYYAKPDGSGIRRIAYGIGINGIGISPDGKTVYGAASFARNILAFSTDLDNAIQTGSFMSGGVKAEQGRGPGAGRVVATFPGRQFLDSMAIEADGTIAQATVFEAFGVARVDPGTGEREQVELPDFLTTNLSFGGADMRDAYVTLSSSARIAKVRWPAAGMRLPFNI